MKVTLFKYFQARRLELTGLLISFLVCCLFVPQVTHFSHRNDTIRVVSQILPLWKTLEELEYRLYDVRFTKRGIRRPPSRDKIAIIGIDQNTLNTLGSWPYPHEWHAQVIRRLKKAGAKSIFFDFDFSARQNIKSDAAFASAVAEAKNVLLPSYFVRGVETTRTKNTLSRTTTSRTINPLGKDGYDEEFLDSTGKLRADKTPAEMGAYRTFAALGLNEQVPDTCLISVLPDSDGALRRYPMATSFWGGDEHIGSAAMLSAGIYEKLLDGEENPRYEKALATSIWPTQNGIAVPVPLVASQPAPGNAPYTPSTLLYFWGPPSDGPEGTFATYSYSNVKGFRTFTHLNDDQSTDSRGHWAWHGLSDSQMKERFGGRIVYIGATALILNDVFEMPQFIKNRVKVDESQSDGSQISGVEIHATATAMLLDGVYLREASTQSTLLTLFALSMLSSLSTILLRDWVNRVAWSAQSRWARWRAPGQIRGLIWFLLYGVLAVLPVVCFWEAAKWLFILQNLWVIVIYPALSAVISNGLVLILLFSSENAERRKTIAQFGRFMAPSILDEVLAHPEEDYPRPRRTHATVLFTDLEGFTAYTDAHEPEEVVYALNAYMTRMIPIVQRYGGTIDKYIGDAIMAYFGAPLPYEDHAKRALLCAVALQEACADFRAETGIEFYMRVGVHTGDVIAGSMGSEGNSESQPLLNYTIIGDTVNLASRLEAKNKEFGSWVMCSTATYEAAPDVVCVESVSTQITGKSRSIEVYKVRGLAGQPPLDGRWGREKL